MNRRKFLTRGLIGAVTVAGMAAVGKAPEVDAKIHEPLPPLQHVSPGGIMRTQPFNDLVDRVNQLSGCVSEPMGTRGRKTGWYRPANETTWQDLSLTN